MNAGTVLRLSLTVALIGCARDARRTVVIATAGPWAQANGAMHRQGVDLAVEELNAAGGIDGRRLVLVARDDEGSGPKAAAIASELVADDSVVAVVGHVNSGAMVAAARVYDAGLPAVSSTASSPDLTGISPFVFRVIASDSVSALHIARFANASGARRAAILYENNAFGRGLVEPFRRHFTGTLVTVDPIPSAGDPEAFEPYVAYLRARTPDVVFVAGSEGSGLALLREARRQGLRATFLGGVGWAGVIADPVASEGVYVGVPFTPEDDRPEARRFVAAFRSRYGREPDSKAALAYDATMVVARAIAEAGPRRAAVAAWLRELNGTRSVAGVTSRAIQFDSTGDVIAGGFVMTRAARGALVEVDPGAR